MGNKQVTVQCVETGKIYSSIIEAADSTYADPNRIRSCLDKPNRTAEGYHWIKLGETDRPRKQDLPIRCVTTKERYDNARILAEESGYAVTTILHHLKYRKPIKGKYYEYV